MENELLTAAGLGLARLGVFALLGYAFYRVLTATQRRVPVGTRNRNTGERLQNTRTR